MSSLVTEIESRVTQPHKSKVQLLPEEYESLSIIMERIINPTELDPKYYEVKIMEFIRYVRGSRVLSAYTAQPNNANVDVLIDVNIHGIQNTVFYNKFCDRCLTL